MGVIDSLKRRQGFFTLDDLNRYKTIPQMTNAYLRGYEPRGNIQTSRGRRFGDVISKLFPQTRRVWGVEFALRHQWERY